jgi:threonine dehydrogenase-like Zn-dependent dehydrogenase
MAPYRSSRSLRRDLSSAGRGQPRRPRAPCPEARRAHVHNLLNLTFDLPMMARRREIAVVATLHDYTLVCASGGQRAHRAEHHRCDVIDVARCARCFCESPSTRRYLSRRRRLLGIDARSFNPRDEASFEIVVEAAGRREGLAQAIEIVRPRGTIVLKSTFHGETNTPLWPAVVHEVPIVGSRCDPFARRMTEQ